MRSPSYLRGQAQRCRRLASQLTNERAAEHLLALAAEYEAEANEQSGEAQMQAGSASDETDPPEQQQPG